MKQISAMQLLAELKSLGTEHTCTTYLRHGAQAPLFGVKFGDLRPIQRRIGTGSRFRFGTVGVWQHGRQDVGVSCGGPHSSQVAGDRLLATRF